MGRGARISCPTVKNGTHNIGPDNGSLQVKTYRGGVASKAGHDLVIDVTSWNATITVEGDSQCTVELNADPRSLEVREGTGGAKPLSDKDKADMAGTTRPVSFEVEVGSDGQVKGIVPLTQSEWGIKPFTAMMGALKVKDDVEVVLEARLPSE